MVKIKIKQQEFYIRQGSDFLEVQRQFPNLPIKFGCKAGECGTCTIKIVQGMENLSQISSLEKDTLRKKRCSELHRLACQCAINGFVEID